VSPRTPGAPQPPASPPPAQPTGHPAQTPAQTHPADDTAHELGELTRALHGLGLQARLLTPATRPPFVRALHPSAPALAENITCAPRPGQGLWFWWSWQDPITHVRHVAAAAHSIHRVLTPGAGQ
jgi:hypothetical protein